MKTIFGILLAPGTVSAALADDYAIGVLAYNGKHEAVERWLPTAEYLTQRIPDSNFSIVPLTLDENHATSAESDESTYDQTTIGAHYHINRKPA